MAAYGIKKESFTKDERLRRRREYERVYRQGKRLSLPYLRIILAPNQLGHSRLGLSVSKKVGNAVKRNYIKRILREVFRRNRDIFPLSHDIVIIPRAKILEIPQDKIKKDLVELFKKYEKNSYKSY
ncbi:ribonuclease P protein component [Thermodesulfatator indicus DSM 15286]|uniref:Ribonuclease P protein component n=1 Tax=Thermodesulfatator indicus (strain DSM 15286 / JCM 11887 / CIR29812) TaxID=667014 RepID=F8ABR3_THEID|nr:ribonuclease P protein component [Thermodesulfatator indicus]AEH44515.1 ribonuclease P protein component [Thermodesulfatator indicus DSM 15286]